jgi:hypothetical protein
MPSKPDDTSASTTGGRSRTFRLSIRKSWVELHAARTARGVQNEDV